LSKIPPKMSVRNNDPDNSRSSVCQNRDFLRLIPKLNILQMPSVSYVHSLKIYLKYRIWVRFRRTIAIHSLFRGNDKANRQLHDGLRKRKRWSEVSKHIWGVFDVQQELSGLHFSSCTYYWVLGRWEQISGNFSVLK